MLERITINLSTNERHALEVCAKNNFRDIRGEARYLICKALRNEGLFSIGKNEEKQPRKEMHE